MAISNINITETDKNDIHFLYTIIYLRYLNLSLLNDNYSYYNKYKNKNNQKLMDLYGEIAQYYQKTNRPIFIKLAGMISSEMGNVDYSEKAGNQYIGLLLKEGNATREIGRTFYNLGVLYEKYSNRGTYNLSTIYTALKYYNIAHKYLDELEKEYIQIESIWKYLYTYNDDELWLNELNQYIDIRVREGTNQYLTLREKEFTEYFIKKGQKSKKIN